MKIIIFLMMSCSSMIPTITHPLSLGMIILTQTILICSISRLMMNSSWISFTLFLVMIGGLMVIFMYITSICSNKKFSFPKIKIPMFYFMIVVIFFTFNKSLIMLEMKDTIQMMDMFNLEFTKLFLSMNMMSSNFMFIYLLIMLIIMINLVNINKGPLRKKY
uniref:NADH dehydrogenase subunit 6 n=1 Tax=Freysuila caesalpiniae TaxID=2008487 RepID=A0A344A2C8_9HEMI|nr:NADH dehydrogenase subunit 6 [Freysuila caesalpiniae]AWU48919.1 NADH dehydrogenase subunit 6 [Freysuila caesalpiniae]